MMRVPFQIRVHRTAVIVALVCVELAASVPGFRGVLSAAPATCQAQSAPEERTQPTILLKQSQAEVESKSGGCISCHTATDSPTMHTSGTVRLGCTDCHGGNAQVFL